MHFLAITIAFTGVLAAQVPFGQVGQVKTNDKILNTEVCSKIGKIVEEHTASGYSVGVFRQGAAVEEEYGQWGSRTEAGDAMSENTIVGIGSMSKAFTATSLGLIMDDFAHGRNVTPLPDGLATFTWDTKLKDLLPDDWKLMDAYASQHARIRDTLSHVSGLPGHGMAYSRIDSTIDIIRRMQYLRPAYDLREKYHYNNIQYMVAQHLIERFTGMTHEKFVVERIFNPLNMTSSTFSLEYAAATGELSESYNPHGRRIPHWLDKSDMPVMAGAGGILSSAVDLLRWGKALLGATNSSLVGIPEDILHRCMAPESRMDASRGQTYGFGWVQTAIMGQKMVWHNGGCPGVSSLIGLFPDLKAVITIQSSAGTKDTANSLVFAEILTSILGSSKDAYKAQIAHEVLRLSEHQPMSAVKRASPSRPPNTSDLGLFAGVYYDPGYGNITLCPFVHPSAACRTVLDEFTALQGELDTSQLYGYYNWPKIWAKYIILTPQSGSVSGSTSTTTFDADTTTIFPCGYGDNTTVFQEGSNDEGVRAEFVVNKEGTVRGFGMFGMAGEVLRREKEGRTVEEKAEVWFTKVM